MSVVALALLVGCGGEVRRDAAPPPREEPASGPVFARGPGVLVTVAQVEARVRETGESPSHAAEALLAEALLAAAAERAGLDRDGEAKRTRRQVLVQKLLEEEVERRVTEETIPDDVVRAHYRKNQRTYVHGEEVRVEHFLARLDEGARPEKVAKAREAAEVVLAAARAAPEAPLESHRGLVPAGTSVKVESLPPFSAGSVFDPAFEAPALALRRPNEISGVVRSSFGFHVIRLLERLPALHRSLAEVEGEIRTKLLPEERKRRLQALLSELGERRGVVVDPRPLASIR